MKIIYEDFDENSNKDFLIIIMNVIEGLAKIIAEFMHGPMLNVLCFTSIMLTILGFLFCCLEPIILADKNINKQKSVYNPQLSLQTQVKKQVQNIKRIRHSTKKASKLSIVYEKQKLENEIDFNIFKLKYLFKEQGKENFKYLTQLIIDAYIPNETARVKKELRKTIYSLLKNKSPYIQIDTKTSTHVFIMKYVGKIPMIVNDTYQLKKNQDVKGLTIGGKHSKGINIRKGNFQKKEIRYISHKLFQKKLNYKFFVHNFAPELVKLINKYKNIILEIKVIDTSGNKKNQIKFFFKFNSDKEPAVNIKGQFSMQDYKNLMWIIRVYKYQEVNK